MIKVQYVGGTKFKAETRGLKTTMDLPADKGGTNSAMTPTELMVTSLGGCIALYVTEYLKQIGLDPAGTMVEMRFEMADAPRRVGRLRAKVEVPAGIPENRRAAVQRVAEHCPVHHTLHGVPETVIEIA
jgi:putative redox protein